MVRDWLRCRRGIQSQTLSKVRLLQIKMIKTTYSLKLSVVLVATALTGCSTPQPGGSPNPAAAINSPSPAQSDQPSKSAESGIGDLFRKAVKEAFTTDKIILGYKEEKKIDPDPFTSARTWCFLDGQSGSVMTSATKGTLGRYPDGRFGVVGKATFDDCAELAKRGMLVMTGYYSKEKAIDRLGLRDLLPQYDPDQPLKSQYPRVAITIHRSPKIWTEMQPFSVKMPVGCWNISMVIWDSATKSRRIAPFDYCLPQDGGEVIISAGVQWPERLQTDVPSLTGIKRTDGPMPPSAVVPNDRETAELALTRGVRSWASIREYSQTDIGVLFGTLRYQLGIREGTTVSHDMRVWITAIKG